MVSMGRNQEIVCTRKQHKTYCFIIITHIPGDFFSKNNRVEFGMSQLVRAQTLYLECDIHRPIW